MKLRILGIYIFGYITGAFCLRSSPCFSKSEHLCDNNRCIYNKLRCNGEDPCGDGSDCNMLSVGAIFGIVVGVCCGIGLAFILYQLRKKYAKSKATLDSDDDEVQPEFSRPHNATSQHEMQEIMNAGVKDYTNHNSNVRNYASDGTYHKNDVMHSNGGAGAYRPMEPSAPMAESNTDRNVPCLPPPPSYNMAINYGDIYTKSEQPNA